METERRLEPDDYYDDNPLLCDAKDTVKELRELLADWDKTPPVLAQQHIKVAHCVICDLLDYIEEIR